MAYQITKQKFSPRIRPEEYDEFRAAIEDSDFPDSFDTWESERVERDKHFESQGFEIVEIAVHTDEFVTWCSRGGISLNMHTLGAFTVAKARGL